MNKEIEAVFLDKILYIGEEIPEALMGDNRAKFILLGTPQDLIDKLTTIYQRGRESGAKSTLNLAQEFMSNDDFQKLLEDYEKALNTNS